MINIAQTPVRSNRRNGRYNKYKIYLPSNLNLDEIISNNPPLYKRMAKLYRNYRDKMAYILHLISAIPNSKKDFDFEKEKGFTPINKVTLAKRVHEYRSFINYLKLQGIIEEGTGYVVGKKSMGLKFTPKYRTVVKPAFITTPSLIKSITKKHHKRDIKAEEKLSFFKDFFTEDLTIDYDKAYSVLEKDKSTSRAKLISKRTERNYTDEELSNLPDIDDLVIMGFNSKLITVEKIHTADYQTYPLIDATTGRLHSPFVILYKKLRGLLKYKNQNLGNVDIVNSQPFLALILLDTDIFNRMDINSLISKYNPLFRSKSIVDKSTGEVIIIPSNYSTMLVNMIQKASMLPDVIAYKQTVINGTYYEYFGEQLMQRNLIPSELLAIENEQERKSAIRNFAKTSTFRALFEKVQARRWSENVRVFAECFPNVFAIFQFVKKGLNNHPTLACILQRFESFLVLHKVCLDIHTDYPDIPLYTIHDSIATTESNVEIVKSYFQKHVKEIMGIEPNLSIEIWK